MQALASVGVPFLWGVALSASCTGCRSTRAATSPAASGDLFSAYSVSRASRSSCSAPATELPSWPRDDRRAARASRAARRRLCLPAATAGAVFVIWTVVVARDTNDSAVFPPAIPAALCVVALVIVVALVAVRRSGWAFAATAAAIGLAVATLFTSLFPRVLVSNPDFGNSLTVGNAAAAHYPLVVITVTALVLLPIVLLYQGWTYHVLRRRLTGPTRPTREIIPSE